VANDFYDVGKIRQIANTLFLGWGYNFYRKENQLRADDQLVCAKAAWLLGLAAQSVQAAEAELRRRTIPPPTREKPFPDPAAMTSAQNLERLGKDIIAIEARLHALPAPSQDLMTLRYRQEAETLSRLIEADERLVGLSELLRSMLDGQPAELVIDRYSDVQAGISAIRATLVDREAILHSRSPES
jgi:hypothetical protein